MCTRNVFSRIGLLSISLVFLLAMMPAGFATPDAPVSDLPQEPESKSEHVEDVQEEIDSGVESQADEKRKRIIQEAADAIAQTKEAIEALQNENADEALAALERVTGKLEIILAREPELALAPTEVTTTTHDLYANADTIKRVVKEAENFLEDGNVQAARALIRGLASEVVINVTHIPLATYPDAIKEVVPLIDNGELDDARARLLVALNTLVVTQHAIPLPPMRAEALLAEAEELAENSERTSEESERLAALLKDARTELEIAEVLGYGTDADYKEMYDQLDEIERKTRGGKSGEGFFDSIKRSISSLFS